MAHKAIPFETPFETYTSSSVVGEGGAGRVYVVTNTAGEELALKCLAAERITSERLKRFKNEIAFCQRTAHPNIVAVIDAGVHLERNTKCPFYVMRRYTGTLRSVLGQISPEQALPIFAQILDGVEAAHLQGVWHRDLKPENILFDERNRNAVIADFGIAHFEEEEIYTAVETKVASRMANFLYSAPEQRVRGTKVDHRCDIFALGLILNELFTKQIPHGAGFETIGDSSPKHKYLDDLVAAMLQQAPGNRPQTIDDVKKELIGRKNAFVAQQEYDARTQEVVHVGEFSGFDPISIVGIDYNDGVLQLKLSRAAPPGWAQEFHQPRGGHAAIMGYGPENFDIRGDTASLRVRNDERFIQEIVNHAKAYVTAANQGYVQRQKALLKKEEQQKRQALEKAVAEAELRKNILANIKL